MTPRDETVRLDDLDDDGPATLVPNRLLARLLEYDSCPHAADYVCTSCGDAARDAAISLLEGPHWSEPSAASGSGLPDTTVRPTIHPTDPEGDQ